MASDLIDQPRSEGVDPFEDRSMRDIYATLGQQLQDLRLDSG